MVEETDSFEGNMATQDLIYEQDSPNQPSGKDQPNHNIQAHIQSIFVRYIYIYINSWEAGR